MSLTAYKKKRNFSLSPEPSGRKALGEGNSIFVVQEHHASHLHWDFRLERGGVLLSWAVPKGVPEDDSKRLAIRVEDHPVAYASFQGVIPSGYGKGVVAMWDQGTYSMIRYGANKIVVELFGERLSGCYVLIRM